MNEPESAKPTSSGSSIFGSAKPIDTSKKEREIEQKLSKLSVDEHRGPRRDDRNYSEKTSLTADQKARLAEEELKGKLKSGHLDIRPECDQKEEIGAASRFAALEEDY